MHHRNRSGRRGLTRIIDRFAVPDRRGLGLGSTISRAMERTERKSSSPKCPPSADQSQAIRYMVPVRCWILSERSSPSRVRYAAPNNRSPLTAPGRS